MEPTGVIEKELVGIGVVVEDVERSAAQYREILGFEFPAQYEYVHATGNPAAVHDGTPASAVAKVVSVPLGRVLFTLLQPLDDQSVWAKFLKAHGPGIHHIRFGAPNPAAAGAHFSEHGYTVAQHGTHIYCETEPALGVTVELLEHTSAPQMDAAHFPTDRGIGTDRVIQVGLVIPDIDTAIQRYQEALELSAPATQETPGYDVVETTFVGEPSDATAKLAFFSAGPQMQIELIEPDAVPSVWRNYLNDKGISGHHIAFAVKDTAQAAAHFAQFGIPVVQQGLYGDRSGMYTYMGSEAQLGIIIELLENFGAPRPKA